MLVTLRLKILKQDQELPDVKWLHPLYPAVVFILVINKIRNYIGGAIDPLFHR